MAELEFKGPIYWENRHRYFSTIWGAFLAVQDQVLGGEIRREDVRVYACRVREGQLVAEEVLAHVWVPDFEHPVVFPESWWASSTLNKNTLGGPRLCPGCRGVKAAHEGLVAEIHALAMRVDHLEKVNKLFLERD